MNNPEIHSKGSPTLDFLLIASFPDSIVSFRGALIESIVASGNTVGVLAPNITEGSIRTDLERLGAFPISIPLTRTGLNPVRDLFLLWRLLRLFQKIGPRYTLSYTVKPIIYGTLAAWIARVPNRFALVTGLGFAFTDNRTGYVSTIVRRLYRLSLGRNHKIFFQNRDDEMLFRKEKIINKDSATVVVNGSGVDISHYAYRKPAGDKIRFLMIGRLLGDKGVREYAGAAKALRSEFPEAEFALAGWIDSNPDAISAPELDEWVRQGCVEFLGRLEDVRPALAQCSVFVLPSYREGMPRTVLEAMATGRAIVTTDVPGCRDTVIEGRNGFLAAARSTANLAQAMRRFLQNPDLVASMGRESRTMAETLFDDRLVNAEMLQEMGLSRENTPKDEAASRSQVEGI